MFNQGWVLHRNDAGEIVAEEAEQLVRFCYIEHKDFGRLSYAHQEVAGDAEHAELVPEGVAREMWYINRGWNDTDRDGHEWQNPQNRPFYRPEYAFNEWYRAAYDLSWEYYRRSCEVDDE